MDKPKEIFLPRTEKIEEAKSTLDKVHKVLIEGTGITATPFGNTLSIVGDFENKEKADEAERKLQELGLSPERTGSQRILLTSKLSAEELTKAKDLYNF